MSNQNSNPPRNVSANNKMLIDATHPEETRVVVQRNGRVEEFDFESAARKLLRGNIYLAKVTRVEPSLQAAFVDYGGNRHGFLAFNEIHPDYYQIPIADRRALIEAETAAEAEEEAAADRAAEAAARRSRRRGGQRPAAPDDEDGAVDVSSMLPQEAGEGSYDDRGHETRAHEIGEPAPSDGEREPSRTIAERNEPDAVLQSQPAADASDESPARETSREPRPETDPEHGGEHPDEARDAGSPEGAVESVDAGNGVEAEQIETVSDNEDVLEEVPMRPRRRLRSYKIQEVTKRRQVLLVQVVKEERGTKGAALTTYLSLAGRYTVLMPNTARGGGISRKITNPQDRKRLKAIAGELDVPEGMGLIIRTAGAARTKQEIKRDYEYLLRLWESVRELALGSNAPALVYEEGNLIKRSIRDLYGKEVEEIIVAGEVAYREAKDFMRMLMPSHAKNVLYYQDPEPLFTRYGMERQLNAMFSPYVHLRSGGYLVINQTEALVAIDINSGKSTREFSIEETALSTNLEAADEIARQLKLRDLAGLVVIDFIDMEEKRNNRSVERRLKDALRHDRARIQLGRISHFGLLEMSRQRMRTGVLEGSTTQCPHCQGTGIIRSTESVALAVLRGIEDSLMTGQPTSLTAATTATVALYILNHKRSFIVEIENRYGITIQILASEKVQGANFTIERQARRDEPLRRPERSAAVNMDWGFEDEDQGAATASASEDEADEADEGSEAVSHSRGERGQGERSNDDAGGGQGGEGRRRRRRRRGRRGDRDGDSGPRPTQANRNEGGRSEGAQGFDRGARSEHGDDGEDAEGGAREVRGYDSDSSNEGPEFVEEAGAGGADADHDGDEAGYNGAPRHGDAEAEGQNGERRRRRRRGRRGGRRNQERERPANGDHPDTVQRSSAEGGDANDRVSEAEAGHGAEPDPAPVYPREAVMSPPASHQADHSNGATETAKRWVAETEPVRAPDDARAAVVEAQPEPKPEPRIEVAAAVEPPAPVQAPVPTPRSAPVASEPVLERVVVGRDAAAAQSAEDAARPARRGWWQRR